jgi:hypothetical protein
MSEENKIGKITLLYIYFKKIKLEKKNQKKRKLKYKMMEKYKKMNKNYL